MPLTTLPPTIATVSTTSSSMGKPNIAVSGARRARPLKQDDFSSNRHPASAPCLSMISSENRFPLFGIML
jgi:hypothetical protein